MERIKESLKIIYLFISPIIIYGSFFCFMVSFMNRYEQYYFNYVFIFIILLSVMIFKNKKENKYVLLSIEIPIYTIMFFSINLWCFLTGTFLEKIFWGTLMMIMTLTIINKDKEFIELKLGTILAGLIASYFYYCFAMSFVGNI